MSDNTIRLTEGDNGVVYQITCKRDGAAINVTGMTVKFFARDDQDTTRGSNQVDDSTCVITDAANGVVEHTFTTAHTNIAGSDKDLRGKWMIKLVQGANTERLKQEPFFIDRNMFEDV